MAKFTTTQTFNTGDQITSGKLNSIVTGLAADSDLAADSTITVSSGQISVGTISASNIGSSAVITAKIAADAVTGAKIADDAVDSEHYVDGSIDEAHLATGAVTWAKTATDDKAAQSDMEGESASHYVSPDVMKYHPGIAKAYGVIDWENGSATVSGGFNISGASDTGGTSRQVTLDVTMANANYTVVATWVEGSSVAAGLAIENKTTTTFDVFGAAEASGRKIQIVVYGDLA
jgi:hypothetical protein